ncbi:hypothetical protein Y888_12960 [Mixta calida B021323]|nr:hypothetical protein Y888_12960 [Mixta calida B021323]
MYRGQRDIFMLDRQSEICFLTEVKMSLFNHRNDPARMDRQRNTGTRQTI